MQVTGGWQMNPFDTAWDLVKDFFFAPEETMQTISTRDDGSVAEFADLMGRMRPPLIEGDSYKNIRENQERREKGLPENRFKPPGYPFVEGKHQPVIIPRTVLFDENVDPYEGPIGHYPRHISSHYGKKQFRGDEGLPHFLGVNLSAMRGGEDDLGDILTALIHEHGHAAIDDELMSILYDSLFASNSKEEADLAYARFLGRMNTERTTLNIQRSS